jgi:hypothetical protein
MSKTLLFGIIFGGVVTGFLVGVSSSPVVGAAIPALVSAIVTAGAVLFRRPSDQLAGEPAKKKVVWELSPREIQRTLGCLLIAFFGAYIVGIGGGSALRTRGWERFREKEPAKLRDAVLRSSDLEEAALRVQMYGALREAGMSDGVMNLMLGKAIPAGSSIRITKILKNLSTNASEFKKDVESQIENIDVARPLQNQK